MKNNDNYYVMPIEFSIAKDFISDNSSKKNCSKNAVFCYGLFKNSSNGLFGVDGSLEGVVMYNFPWGSRIKSSIFNSSFDGEILEMHRICLKSSNSIENYMLLVSKSVENIEETYKNVKCVLVFDNNENNETAYLLSGFFPCGKSRVNKRRYIRFIVDDWDSVSYVLNSCKYDINELDIDIDTTLKCLKLVWEEHKEMKLGELFGTKGLTNLVFINWIKSMHKC